MRWSTHSEKGRLNLTFHRTPNTKSLVRFELGVMAEDIFRRLPPLPPYFAVADTDSFALYFSETQTVSDEEPAFEFSDLPKVQYDELTNSMVFTDAYEQRHSCILCGV